MGRYVFQTVQEVHSSGFWNAKRMPPMLGGGAGLPATKRATLSSRGCNSVVGCPTCWPCSAAATAMNTLPCSGSSSASHNCRMSHMRVGRQGLYPSRTVHAAPRTLLTACSPPQHSRSRPSACAQLTTPHPLWTKPRFVYAGPSAAQSSDGLSPDKTQFGDRLEGHMVPPKISKSDAHFADMGLEFVASKDGIVLAELNDLFEKVGFPRRDPDKLRIALDNTYHMIWIRSARQSRMARLGQMVGFARATSDGVLSATIWDVAILPAWQRCGLGRALVERLTAKLVTDDIPTITLYAEPNVVGLYEKLGFMRDPDGIRGMAFQRKKTNKAGQRQPALVR